jgi:hypothetical protein
VNRRGCTAGVVVVAIATLPATAGVGAAQSTATAAIDAGTPSAADGESTAGTQAGADATVDASVPSATDAGVDAGAPSATDAGVDAGVQGASSELDGAPSAGGPEPLWVPDPEQVSESSSDEAPVADDAQSEASVAIDALPAGDDSRVAIAHWMAAGAQAAGIPGELPVMAALTESNLTNMPYGDADSVGFFQMRTSVWDHGEYAGYLARPELQLRWFVDHATALRDQRRAAGDATYGEDPATWGEWIADVEQPYAPYRGRYQLHLDEARGLLAQPAASISPLALGLTVGGPAAPSEPSAPADDSSGDAIARQVIADPRITLDPRALGDLQTPGRVDPRLCAVLLEAAKMYPISIWVIQTGHSYYTVGGSVSNHSSGRAVDIGSVDGEVVTPTNDKAHKLALALGQLPQPLRPTEIGSPWAIDDPAYFTDADHQNHLHVGYDDPPVPGDAAASAALVLDGGAAGPARASAPSAEPHFQAGDAADSGARPAAADRSTDKAKDAADDATSAEPHFDVGP